MDNTQRISQWENMTQADPENALGWMSLGNAYKDDQRLDDAACALGKAIELDKSLSRVYQVLGQVLIELEQTDKAGELLAEGYVIAAEQGDVMPQKAMGSLLEKIDKPVPNVAEKVSNEPLSADQILDRRTGKPGARLPDPPMRGAIGKFIFDHYTQPTWQEWIGMGTKVINEMHLDFSNKDHQKVYEDQMMEWLGISKEDVESYVPTDGEGKG